METVWKESSFNINLLSMMSWHSCVLLFSGVFQLNVTLLFSLVGTAFACNPPLPLDGSVYENVIENLLHLPFP